tara:strand:- start:73 stop:813 length:741 start_codon:yes stop_codon:yes gene_type:complete
MNFKYLKYLDDKFLNNAIYKFYKKFYLNYKIQKTQTVSMTTINNLDKYKFLEYWNMHFSHIMKNSLKGDIVECGVGNGFHLSFLLFNMITKEKLSDKKYYGFDSFEGFPMPSKEDSSIRKSKKGDWDHTDENYVKNNLKKIGFKNEDFTKINFIKGYFNETLNLQKNRIDNICLLHLDCDLYQSYKDSLEFLYPKVVRNGIIAFDEYVNEEWAFPGAVKAINEFFGENVKKIQKCSLTGKSYLIKK